MRSADHRVVQVRHVPGDRARAVRQPLDLVPLVHSTGEIDHNMPTFALGAWSVYPYFESGLIAVSSGAEGVFFLRHTPAEPPTS